MQGTKDRGGETLRALELQRKLGEAEKEKVSNNLLKKSVLVELLKGGPWGVLFCSKCQRGKKKRHGGRNSLGGRGRKAHSSEGRKTDCFVLFRKFEGGEGK